ncbi:hypothetical protein [Rickettsiales endosymbiont of Peranema trichophorum]|uniref:hypothetical protein n=1 Tax=Rickettsiales endosymbiont of Peranema trichophorum TaxID=2486577 RepID=UPI001023A06C|nr:hypothetical protein [Rickettsiales endosymbiont of Peranema trichophorum]
MKYVRRADFHKIRFESFKNESWYHQCSDSVGNVSKTRWMPVFTGITKKRSGNGKEGNAGMAKERERR